MRVREGYIVLCLVPLVALFLIVEVEAKGNKTNVVVYQENKTFCFGLGLLKKETKLLIISENKTVDRICPKFEERNLMFFFSLFVIIGWGALVRTFLRMTKLSIPYTVLLMISGLVLGLGTRIGGKITEHQTFCAFYSVYTKIARTPPKIILYTFLPVIIFESAFNMKVHVFMRSAWQILVVALPGMMITTFITAAVCQQFMHSYHWSYIQASFFGSIISATDPVAVVSILRELGTSDTLSTIIEGESLLNDGVAILLYEIFRDIVTESEESTHGGGNSHLVNDVVKKFLLISLGGPLLGLVAGKIAVVCLSLIFNDAAVEITITLVAAYLTYYGGETLGVSGVVAVVVLGIRMNSDSTSISPEVEDLVHHFWEMLGYLANTVLFVIVGILITETAINQINATDVFYLAFFYVAVNIIRLVMLMLLMPWLSRIGYGLKWRDMITMMWGGLRGAVGLCLSLEVYRNSDICKIDNDRLGPKFLFHTAGIVFLTLVINGTTTKMLLRVLGLTIISPGRLQDMANAVKQINGAQIRTLAVLKHDRFLADANWDLVDRFTGIYDPYNKERKKSLKTVPANSVISLKLAENDNRMDCPECGTDIPTEPSSDGYRIMTEEARLRLLKALKVSFWRQYEQGVLTEVATQILIGVAETTADKELHMIHARDFRFYFTVHGFFNWVRINVIKKLGIDMTAILPPKPQAKCRKPFWWLSTRDWFEGMIHLIVLINMIPIIWETVLQLKPNHRFDHLEEKFEADNKSLTGAETKELDRMLKEIEKRNLIFLIINCVFTSIYLLEFLIKLIGHGCKEYWSSKWNWLDVVILIVSIVDIIVSITYPNVKIRSIRISVQIFRFGRISRSLRLFRPMLPRIYRFIDVRINATLFLGYDVGKGFVTAVDDVLKFLPQIVEHPRVLHKLRVALEHERLEAVRAMGLLQKDHHRIAIGVKTRHASRAVLNQMRETLGELKEDGLLDDKESTILMTLLEEKMKRLWNTPSSIHPSPPESLLLNVVWLLGNEELGNFIAKRAILLNFKFGDVISAVGDIPNGIFVIISGMVKIHYTPTPEVVKGQHNFGIIPNLDLFNDMTADSEETDFFSTGTVIGEMGILTGHLSAATVTCETDVIAYHIHQDVMEEGMTVFHEKNDSLEARLWRSCGMRIASALLPSQAIFQSWTLDKIRMHLERSAVPVGNKFETMTVPDFIANVVLIYGQIVDAHTKDIYTAPCLLPHTCTKICPVEGAPVKGKILIVAHEEIDHEEVPGSSTSLHRVVVNSTAMRRDLLLPIPASDDPSKVSFRQRRVSQAINFGVRRKSMAQPDNALTIIVPKGPIPQNPGKSPSLKNLRK